MRSSSVYCSMPFVAQLRAAEDGQHTQPLTVPAACDPEPANADQAGQHEAHRIGQQASAVRPLEQHGHGEDAQVRRREPGRHQRLGAQVP